jgi:hypothetical protein
MKTPNDGAAAERACWMRKVSREAKADPNPALDSLLAWGRLRTKRNVKKGGLGRK